MASGITSSSPWKTSLMQNFKRQVVAMLPELRQTLPGVAAVFARSEEQGRVEAHVDSLLAILRFNRIQLSSHQEEELGKMTLAQLPEIQVALDAASAEGFMAQARLCKAAQP